MDTKYGAVKEREFNKRPVKHVALPSSSLDVVKTKEQSFSVCQPSGGQGVA